MNPREFLEAVVRPNVEELSEDYSSVRKAFNAIAALDAFAAHIFHHLSSTGHADVAGTIDDSHYRENLAAEFEDFRLLRDVAKAHKHVWLTRGAPLVSSTQQTSSKSLGWGEARWGEGRWGSPQQVVVTTNSSDNRVVESVAKSCLGFLEDKLIAYHL